MIETEVNVYRNVKLSRHSCCASKVLSRYYNCLISIEAAKLSQCIAQLICVTKYCQTNVDVEHTCS
jgi:hypothetical protein